MEGNLDLCLLHSKWRCQTSGLSYKDPNPRQAVGQDPWQLHLSPTSVSAPAMSHEVLIPRILNNSVACATCLYPILPTTIRDARYTSNIRFVNVKPPWFPLPHRAPFSSESNFCHSIYHRELISVQRAPLSMAIFFAALRLIP